MWTERRLWSNGKAHPPSADPFLPSRHNHRHHYYRSTRKSYFLIINFFLGVRLVSTFLQCAEKFFEPSPAACQLLHIFFRPPTSHSAFPLFPKNLFWLFTFFSQPILVVSNVSSFKHIPIFGILPSFSKSILLQKLSKDGFWFSSFQFVIFWT